MACYRVAKDGKAIRVSFSVGRAFWRELPALVPDPTGQFNQGAAILAWATNLRNRLGQLDAPVPVLVAGLASDQAKLLRWRVEQLDLPLALLVDPDAAAELRAQIRSVEDFFSRLRAPCATMIAGAMPDPTHKDTKARARTILDTDATAAVFCSGAERALPDLMQRIASGDIEGAQRHWAETLKAAAFRAWLATHHSLGDSSHALRAEARAYPRFRGLLRTLDQPDLATTTEETEA
jgi:CRISPR system Cascade subunit CasA